MPMPRHASTRIGTYEKLGGHAYLVEGTRLIVLELLHFGFAYSSYYLLLKAGTDLARLNEEAIAAEVVRKPSKFGRRLEFGPDLERDPTTQEVCYIGDVSRPRARPRLKPAPHKTEPAARRKK
jgi:hypothetical protein